MLLYRLAIGLMSIQAPTTTCGTNVSLIICCLCFCCLNLQLDFLPVCELQLHLLLLSTCILSIKKHSLEINKINQMEKCLQSAPKNAKNVLADVVQC